MIVYPVDWFKKYEKFARRGCKKFITAVEIIDILKEIIFDIGVNHLAYSGGVDSTILLCLMSDIYDEVNTYTISSKEDNKDIFFSRIGSDIYKSNHHEFIVKPTKKETDVGIGDNAVRQLFENIENLTDKIICGDGIDEFMCGYYIHQDLTFNTYFKCLEELSSKHLVPLNRNSGNTEVFLPYLDDRMVNITRNIPLTEKVDGDTRKKVIVDIAKHLNIDEEIIYRNKYGFVNAFIGKKQMRDIKNEQNRMDR